MSDVCMVAGCDAPAVWRKVSTFPGWHPGEVFAACEAHGSRPEPARKLVQLAEFLEELGVRRG